MPVLSDKKTNNLPVQGRLQDDYIDLKRETPAKERWITKQPRKTITAKRLRIKLAAVVAELSGLKKSERTAILAACGLQERPMSSDSACDHPNASVNLVKADDLPSLAGLQPHALPPGLPYQLPPPSMRRAADLTPEQNAINRERKRLEMRNYRAKKAQAKLAVPSPE